MRSLMLMALLLLATPALAIAPIHEWKMANGLRVLLMEAHTVPMVVMRLTLPAGSSMDAPGKAGTASMLAAMLGDHTARYDYRAWADHLDAQAIRFGVGADRDGLSLRATVLSEVTEQAVAVLAEALMQPGWSSQRFEIMRADTISALNKSLEQPPVRAAIAAVHHLYGDHPYGHRTSGSPESLLTLKISDLKRLYRDQVKPDQAVLAVSGDVTMAQLKQLLAPLSAWKGRAKRRLQQLPKAPLPKAENIHIAMNTHQSTVQLVRIGLNRQAVDLFPTLVMNHILGGGGFSSQLMTEVREKRGLVYGVYSYFQPLTVAGPFVISLQTRADQAEKALAVVRQVMASMAQGKISREALQAAKDHLTGGFAHRLDSNGKRVGLMSMIGYYHLPLDYLQRWTDRIDAVSLKQVKQSAARYLAAAAWTEIAVGPK
ncbi:MAG: pitrilysin family protein [Mariprofundales bacterium]